MPSDSGSAARGGQDEPLRLWVVGGTAAHRGGLESYCERAVAALGAHGEGYAVRGLPTDTAYLTPGRIPVMMGRLLTFVRARREIDLVWVQVSNLPEALYLVLAKLLGIPAFVTPHYGANSRLQTTAWRRGLLQVLLRRAACIGTLFEGQHREISLPDGVPRLVIGTFLPERAFADAGEAAPEAEAPLRLIHAARFSAEKGSFLMVDLCARLVQAGVPVSGVLLGRADPATMAALHEKIAAQGLERHIALPGWLAEAETQAALAEADVLVHLSTIDSFPLIVLEAQAAGALPIVIPMAGGQYMVETYGGYVVEGSDPVGSALAWLQGLPRAELRAQGQGTAARVRAQCGWPQIAARVAACVRLVRAEG